MDDGTPKESEHKASQPRCINMPNDEPEGHYWSWVNAPQSIPNQYRECMTCGRLDASEWLASRDQQIALEAKVSVLKQLTSQDRYTNRDVYAQKLISDCNELLALLKSKQKGTSNDE